MTRKLVAEPAKSGRSLHGMNLEMQFGSGLRGASRSALDRRDPAGNLTPVFVLRSGIIVPARHQPLCPVTEARTTTAWELALPAPLTHYKP